jgi:hypothetical protein
MGRNTKLCDALIKKTITPYSKVHFWKKSPTSSPTRILPVLLPCKLVCTAMKRSYKPIISCCHCENILNLKQIWAGNINNNKNAQYKVAVSGRSCNEPRHFSERLRIQPNIILITDLQTPKVYPVFLKSKYFVVSIHISGPGHAREL